MRIDGCSLGELAALVPETYEFGARGVGGYDLSWSCGTPIDCDHIEEISIETGLPRCGTLSPFRS
jgi:hypothetical protein